MSLLHLTPQSREALHDHIYYGAVTLAMLVLGSAASMTIGALIQVGAA